MLEASEYLYFAYRAFDGMAAIVGSLGDDLANRVPSLPGANSPYALLTHCIGVSDFWGGHLVNGRKIERDRAAEFTSTGPVAPLLQRVIDAKARLAEYVAGADPRAPLRDEPPAAFQGPDQALTQAGALQHIYEELTQHYGQMEILRDVILAEANGSLEAKG